LKDLLGSADSVSSGVCSFVPDRFNNPNSALYLNNAYLTLPSGTYFNGGPFSFMGWIYLFDIVHVINFFSFGNGNYNNNIYLQSNNGVPYGYIFNYNNFFAMLASTKNYQISAWTHTAFTFDGTNAMIYINGTLISSSVATYVPLNVNRPYCYFGVQSFGPMNPNGNMYIDDFRIYNRAVDASEMLTIMILT
jgi:hypothetical protein